MNMTQIEFIEALGRAAEKSTLPNLLKDAELFEERSVDEVLADKSLHEKWHGRALHEKIEALLLMIAYKCVSERFYRETVVPLFEEHDSDLD